jgi:hypothetical protein
MTQLKRRFERWVVLPDIHVPFHNVVLLNKVCRFIHDIKVHGIILAGDFLDLFSLSFFSQNSLYDLKNVTLTNEYEAGIAVLDQIERAVGRGAKRHYLYGNHEARFINYLRDGDHAKMGDELRSPEQALTLRERGYKVYRNWMDDAVKLGDHLEVIHGTYTNVHTAKKHLEEFQGSVMFGHSHRYQTYIDGKRGAYNIGFLGDRDSKGFRYFPRSKRNKWVNGFALVNVDANGYYWAETIQAWNNRFIANGKVY